MRVSVSRSIPELSSVTGLLSWEPGDACWEIEGNYTNKFRNEKDNMSWHYAGDIAQCQMFSKPSEHSKISRPCACLLMIDASQGRQLIRGMRNGVALCGRVRLSWPGGAVITQGCLLKEGNPLHMFLTCGQATRTLGTSGGKISLPKRPLMRVVSKPGSQTHSSFYYTSWLSSLSVKRDKPLVSANVYVSSEPSSSCYLISYLRKVLYLKCFIHSGCVKCGTIACAWSAYLTGRPLFLTLLKRSSSAVYYEPCW